MLIIKNSIKLSKLISGFISFVDKIQMRLNTFRFFFVVCFAFGILFLLGQLNCTTFLTKLFFINYHRSCRNKVSHIIATLLLQIYILNSWITFWWRPHLQRIYDHANVWNLDRVQSTRLRDDHAKLRPCGRLLSNLKNKFEVKKNIKDLMGPKIIYMRRYF